MSLQYNTTHPYGIPRKVKRKRLWLYIRRVLYLHLHFILLSNINRTCSSTLMNLVEVSYSAALGAIALILIFHRLFHIISYIFATYLRHHILAHFVYSGIDTRLLGIRSTSKLHLIILILYFVGTGICNYLGVKSISEAGTRTAHLSLINLLPLFLSGARILVPAFWASP